MDETLIHMAWIGRFMPATLYRYSLLDAMATVVFYRFRTEE